MLGRLFYFLLIILFLTIFLTIIAVPLKITNGLFFSRFPAQFLRDRHDPRFEKERQAGQNYVYLVLNYVFPLGIAACIGVIILWLLKNF